MKIDLKLIVGIVMVTLFISSNPTSIYACSCAQPFSVTEELESKMAVFSGKVVSIDQSSFNVSDSPVRVLFQVKESWKGVTHNQVFVFTALQSASCGYTFTEGVEYIVYANEHKGKLHTGICDRTKQLSAAEEDLNILGKGKAPTTSVDLKKDDLTKKIFIAIFIGVTIILVSAFFIRRKK